jgi:DNA-binding beta-propeller fold protein YncE
LKPDSGELLVSNYDSDSISIVETAANEVEGSSLIGTHPVWGTITADNSLLYESNFGSDSVAVYSIDRRRVVDTVSVGNEPEKLALTSNEDFLLVLNTGSSDVAVVRVKKLVGTSKISAERALYNLVPVGIEPHDMAIKAFFLTKPTGKP